MTKQELKEEVMREFNEEFGIDKIWGELGAENIKMVESIKSFISKVIDRTAEETVKAVIEEEVFGMIKNPFLVFRYNEFNK